MFLDVKDESIRYTGRWHIKEGAAITNAPGAMIEIAFTGEAAVLHFNTFMNMHPYPHLWISVDNGAKIEVAVDHAIRVEAPEWGEHVIKIIYKSAAEIQHRWHLPLIGKIDFSGVEVDEKAELFEDNRKIIEFIGDSITEGVLIDAHYQYEQEGQFNRPLQDDSTATYAYLTAEKLGMKPYIIGYGAVGVTKGGLGAVPKANEAYPYNFVWSEASPSGAEIIVINHGANDRRESSERYIEEYEKLLKTVRSINPDSKLVCLSAFCGAHAKELGEFIEGFNRENNENISFIDSSGWIPPEPLHPDREGHKIVAEKLAESLKRIFKL